MGENDTPGTGTGGTGTTHRLKYPIVTVISGHQGERTEEIAEVTMRRATGAEMLLIDQFQGRPMALVMEMIHRLSGLRLKEVHKLDAADIGPLGDLAFSNVEDGRPTGETVSAT